MKQLFTYRLITLILVLGIWTNKAMAQITEDFITTWEVTDDNLTVKMSRWTELQYNYSIDWGDGTKQSSQTGSPEHTYSRAGTYTIKIDGFAFPGIRIVNAATRQIRTVEQWGNNRWETFEDAFKDCADLVINATDAPNLGSVRSMDDMFNGATRMTGDFSQWSTRLVTSMESMFQDANSFNSDLSNWDVGNVTNMRAMFSGATAFNSDLSDWDVSNVTDMSLMFDATGAFNSNLNDWNVSKVTDMQYMFNRAAAFNNDLDNWNVGNVTNVSFMFNEASAFNGKMTGWNLSKVTSLEKMFYKATSFNGDVSGWKVENVTEMIQAFWDATSFNQPLNDWDVSSVTDMSSMFNSASSFNQDLDKWNTANVTKMTGMFNGAIAFNGNIGTWNVSKVTSLQQMFGGASAFNADISAWDVSSANGFASMFSGASAFNADISNWNVSGLIEINNMFQNATAFNQPIGKWDIQLAPASSSIFENAAAFDQNLGNWNVESASSMNGLFSGSGMSVQNYNATLFGWSQQSLRSNVSIDVDGLEYCNIGELSRQKLIADFNWTFSGDSEIQCPPTLFSGAKDSDTQLTVTFDVEVQTNKGNPTDFTVKDAFGTNFAVAAQADGTAGDSEVVLTVANLSAAIGDLTVNYTNNNSEIKDTTPNELEAGDSDIEIDTDIEAPTLVSAVRDSDTQITLTFNEPVQTKGGGLFAFTVTDDDNNSFEVTAQADGTARDNQIVLTVEDLSPAVGLITFNYINNLQISDFGGNPLDNTSALVCADGFTCNLITKTLCTEERFILNSGLEVINPEKLVQVDTVGTVITQYRFSIDESINCCPDGFTCDVIAVNSCEFPYTSPLGNTTSEVGRVIDMDYTNQVRNVYNVTFDRAEPTVDVFQNATIAESGSVTYEANTDATGVLTFDTSQDYYVDLNTLQDDLDGTNRSVFMWVKSKGNVTDFEVLFSTNREGTGAPITTLYIHPSNDQLRVNAQNAIFQNSNFNLSGDVWNYVGYTYDATTFLTSIYVNGILTTTFTRDQSTTATSRYSLGQEFNGTTERFHYNGDMAEVSVWNEVLTGADIRQAMQQKIDNTHPRHANLKGYYSVFGACDDDNTVLKDHSGNNNDGVMKNSFTQDFENVQSISGFNAAAWYDNFSWKKDGAEVSTASTFTTDVGVGNYEFTATRNFVQSSDTWSMTLNNNATTVDNIADETLCADDPITRSVTANAVNYIDFEEGDQRFISINGLADRLADKSRSVFMWFNLESGVSNNNFNELLVFQGNDVSKMGRFYIRETERLALWDANNSRINSTTDLDRGVWYFIGYTYDNEAKVGKVYVNGVEEGSGTIDMPLGQGWMTTLGAKHTNTSLEDYLDGQMAELSIWDKVLSQEEITTLMGTAPAYDANNLVAAYGTLPSIADDQLRDLTSNDIDGLTSHIGMTVDTAEVVLADYDASANYTFSWKKGEAEFDTDATGNITVEEGTTVYSVTYGTRLFQKADAFTLSYTNLIPTQPISQTAGITGTAIFEVDEIEGATYQWFKKGPATWDITLAGENGFSNDEDIETVHLDGNTVYAGSNGGGLSISYNGGFNWVTTTSAQNGFAGSNEIKSIDAEGKSVYVITTEGLSISSDRGSNWKTITQGPNGSFQNRVNVVNVENDKIYVGNYELLISSDKGESWTSISSVDMGASSNAGVVDIFAEGDDVYVSFSGSILTRSKDGGTNWEVIGLKGENGFTTGAISDTYVDDGVIYVTSRDIQNGNTGFASISISSDGGATWSKIESNQNGFATITQFFDIHVEGNIFYVGTNQGIYKSTDGGNNWSRFAYLGQDGFLERGGLNSVRVGDGEIYVGSNVGFAAYKEDVFLVDNPNDNEKNQIQGATNHQLTINNLSLDQNATEYFVEVTLEDCTQASDVVAVTVLDVPVVSTFTPANGATDVAIDTDLSMEFSKTVIKGTGELKLFNYATDALVQTFTADELTVNGNTVSVALTASLDYTTQYYITLDANLVQDNSNAGNLAVTDKDTWSFRTTCEPLVLSQPEDENGVLGGSVTFSVPEVTGASYQWFESGGANWTTITAGMNGFANVAGHVLSVYADGDVISAGTADAGLSISKDGGDSWVTTTSGQNGFASSDVVYSVFIQGSTIYAAGDGGLSISKDGGDNWTTTTAGQNGFANSNSVFSVYVEGNVVYAGTGAGLSISEDGGDSWNIPNTDATRSVFVEGNVIYQGLSNGGLSVSRDGGTNWTTTTTGQNGFANSNQVWSIYAAGNVVYAGTNGAGLSISQDGGANWTTTTSGQNGFANSNNIYSIYADGDAIYVGTKSGLSISHDGGRTWTTTTRGQNGFANSNTVRAVYLDSNTVYAGTGNGLSILGAPKSLENNSDNGAANQITGATTHQLTINNLTQDFDQTRYYVVVTKGSCEETSETVTLTISEPLPALEISSTNPNATRNALIDFPFITINFAENVVPGSGILTVYDASDDSVIEQFVPSDFNFGTLGQSNRPQVRMSQNWEFDGSYYVQYSNGFFTNVGGTKALIAVTDKTTFAFVGESIEPSIISSFFPATGSNTYVADSGDDFVLNTSESVAPARNLLGTVRVYRATNNELVKTFELDGENDRDLDYPDDDSEIRFEFATDELESGTEYYVLIDDGFIISYDNEYYHVGISDPNTWRFTTLAIASTPTLTNTSPATGANDVNISADIELTYSENIQAHVFGETMNVVNNLVLYDADNNVVETFPANTLSYSGATVTINPTNDLDYNATYYLLIDAEVFISNNRTTTAAVTDPTVISFTTGSQPNTAPVASAQDFTGNLEVNQQLTGSYTYTDADADAESGTTFQWYLADDAAGANSTAINGATTQNYSLTASEAGKFVALAITPNDGTDAGTEVFTTYKGAVAAAVIPTLVSTVPADEAMDISITPSLSLVLSEPVTLGVGRINITDGSSSVSFAANSTNVSVSGSTVSIADVGPFPLSNGTYYTVTFEPSAFMDTDGNNSAGLTSQTVWNFTTVEAQVAPVASAVSINKSIIVAGTLQGSYSYSDGNDDPESGSTYQWYRADDAAGSNKAAISGANSQDYIATATDNNKFVSFEVTPNDGNLAGTAVESDFFGPVLVNDGVTNIPPAFTSDPLVTILDNVNYSYTITTEDLNAGHVVSLTKTTGPAWLTLSGGVLSGNPAGQVGDHMVVLTADDSNGGTVTQEFTVTVEASNTAPSVNGIEVSGITTIDEQLTGAYNFIDAENDADNSSYKWYRADDNTGTNKTAIAGAISTTYTLTADDAGKFISFEVTPNDSKVDGTLAESTVVGAVAKKIPTLSLTAISKVYGDADFDLAASTNSTGAITYSFDNDQTSANISGATVTLGNVGEITIDVSLAEDAEYQARQVHGSITVGKRAIEVTATSGSKAVGESDPTLSFTVTSGAVVGSDEVVTIARDAGEAVGTYAISFTDGTAASNYDITKVDGLFTINAVAITVTADAATKTYGEADPQFTYTITTGALNGEDVLSGAITREAGEDVGTYALQSSLFNSDYDITFVPANLTVGKADLTATANDQTKFIGEANPALTISYSGFVNGDTETNITEPNAATFADESSPLGTYDITLSGGAATNYNLNLVNGTLTVAQRPFITTWEITSSDVNRSRTFFTAVSGQTYLYDVDWGDNTIETNQVASAAHTYTESGTYTIKITGQFPQIQTSFGGLESVEQWGDIVWESMESAFVGSSFNINATDAPDFSQVTSMKGMFDRANIGTADLTGWDVSTITDMSEMFKESDFNGDISNWDVSNVTTMSFMFAQTANFNSDITSWNTSGVQDMSYMFYFTNVFNQAIDGWNVSAVTDMSSMFADAAAFNQDLNNWDVSKVTTMEKMFDNAELFNGNITGWDVSSVTDMSNMFDDAKVFNQDIDGWNVSNVAEMNAMFNDAEAFNQDLNSWNTSKVTTFVAMFQNTDVFNGAISNWDVSNATRLERMFEDAHAFNQDISNWRPTNAENLTAMFRDARAFNQDISSWRFPNANSLSQMFYEAAVFNQDISSWETASITDMSSMFEDAEAFNQDISGWDVSAVTSFGSMFRGTLAFNQDIGQWDMSAATGISSMFKNAAVFNQDISGWTFASGDRKLTSMSSVFENAAAFDQDLSGWDLTNIRSLSSIFSNSGMSIASYDATLIGWAAQEVQDEVEFGVEGLQYCAGNAARQSLIDDHNWTIENDSQSCSATVTIADVSGNEDDGNITVSLTSDAFIVDGFTVDVSTADGTATAGTDYAAITSQTITFAGTVGETQTFTITPTADADVEGNETLTVSMSNLVTGTENTVTITDDATITIIGDDEPVVSFTATTASNSESVTSSAIEVSLDQAGLSTVTVDYTVTGTASSGTDYTLANGTLTFATGDVSETISLAIIDDAAIEADETVIITLSNASGASIGANTVFTYTIVNNDAQVTIEDVTQPEDGESFMVAATLEGNIAGGFTIDVSTNDGTATTADSDYTAIAGQTLTFTGTDGETKTFNVTPGVDTKLEVNETFTVSMSNLAATTADVVITDQATMTITNDDMASLTIEDASGREAAGPITLTATLSNAVQGGFTVDVSTADGTATIADSDYTALAGQTLTFTGTAGETQTFTVTPIEDIVIEADEDLTVSLSNLSTSLAVDITDGATVTIVNDDFNNAPTDITLSATSIDENQAIDALVATLGTTDADAADTHAYSLVAGEGSEDNGFFTLTGNELRATRSYNFEFKPDYRIRLQTDDSKGGVFEKIVTIDINDVNEAPFQISISNRTITESDEAQEVGILMTLDPDNGDSFTYELVEGEQDAHNAQFEIAGSTVRTAGAIDFEEGASRDFRVRVTDSGGLTFEWGFTIIIEDVTEEPVRPFTNEPGGEVKNVFSPNGDGVNETWVIEDLQDNPVNEVRVYAQGGKLLYSQTNYQNDWDGTFKGDPIPDGTYYYEIIIFENSQTNTPARVIKGFLTIIRNR